VLTRIFRLRRGEVTGEVTISSTICKVSEVNKAPFFREELNHVGRGLFKLYCITSYYYFQLYALHPSRLIVRSRLDVPTFATTRLHACHHARVPSGGRWNCGRENIREFCLNAEFNFTFRDLIHAVKLRHGTDDFTSPPKEGVLRMFSS